MAARKIRRDAATENRRFGADRRCKARQASLAIFAFCFLMPFLDGFESATPSVAAPAMIRALHFDKSTMGIVFISRFFGVLVGSLLIGFVSDRWGRKIGSLTPLALYRLPALATVLVTNGNELIVLRAGRRRHRRRHAGNAAHLARLFRRRHHLSEIQSWLPVFLEIFRPVAHRVLHLSLRGFGRHRHLARRHGRAVLSDAHLQQRRGLGVGHRAHRLDHRTRLSSATCSRRSCRCSSCATFSPRPISSWR